MTHLGVRRVGMWRAAASGWRVFVPAVLINAAVQASLIISDPVPALSWSFGLLVVASLAAVLSTVWLVTCAALAAVDGQPRTALAAAWRRPAVLLWAFGVGLVTIAGAVWAAWIAPLLLIIGALLLPPAADGARNPLTAGLGVIRRVPLRCLVSAVGLIVVAVLTWVIALVLGFFVTGPLGAALTWVWLGAVLVPALCLCCSLYRRAAPPLP